MEAWIPRAARVCGLRANSHLVLGFKVDGYTDMAVVRFAINCTGTYRDHVNPLDFLCQVPARPGSNRRLRRSRSQLRKPRKRAGSADPRGIADTMRGGTTCRSSFAAGTHSAYSASRPAATRSRISSTTSSPWLTALTFDTTGKISARFASDATARSFRWRHLRGRTVSWTFFRYG
jgi:hypothetical protein